MIFEDEYFKCVEYLCFIFESENIRFSMKFDKKYLFSRVPISTAGGFNIIAM